MSETLAALLIPADLSVFAFSVLLVVSFLASFLSVVCGVGGGTLLVASMAVWMPLNVVVPVHSVIQLSSNLSRISISYRSIRWPVALGLGLGTLVGVGIGAGIVANAPAELMQIVLCVFVIYTVWGTMPKMHSPPNWLHGVVGLLTSILSMLIGATGPLVAAYVRTLKLDRFAYIGTLSFTLGLQNALKAAAFVWIGFAFAEFIPFILTLMIIGFFGTWAGRYAIGKMNEALFQNLLRVVLTLLALRLGYTGVMDFFIN